jgi:predicted transcriptional regulator YdeE
MIENVKNPWLAFAYSPGIGGRRMRMRIESVDRFYVAGGRSVRTTNEGGRSAIDQGGLWQACLSEGLFRDCPEILGVYSGYEGDWTKPFTFTLGVRLGASATAIEGRETLGVKGGEFAVFEASAPSPQEAASAVWAEIWAWQANSPRPRAYREDFESWDAASLAGGKARVRVFVSLT